jgi:hypothetical protein
LVNIIINMKIDFEKIKELCRLLVEEEKKRDKNFTLQNDLIKSTLLWILRIDASKIDYHRSELIYDLDSFQLKLVSNNNISCCLYVSIFENKEIDIRLNKGGEYLYMQSIENQEDLDKLNSTFGDLLMGQIYEIVKETNSKILSVKYTVTHIIDGYERPQDYTSFFGFSWPGENVYVMEKVYKPWIS